MIDVKALSATALIKIVEIPKDWQPQVYQKALSELNSRNWEENELKALATDLYRKRCLKALDKSGFNPKKISIPYSHLLNPDEREDLFYETLDEYLADRSAHLDGIDYLA